jgi:hypothetical protein
MCWPGFQERKCRGCVSSAEFLRRFEYEGIHDHEIGAKTAAYVWSITSYHWNEQTLAGKDLENNTKKIMAHTQLNHVTKRIK